MSDRRLALAVLLLAGLATTTGAQTAGEWRARVTAKAADARSARVAFDSIAEETTRLKKTMRVEGITIRYVEQDVAPGDTAELAAGIRLGVERLRAHFGPMAWTPRDSLSWLLRSNGPPRWIGHVYELDGLQQGAGSVRLTRPIDLDDVATFVSFQAAFQLRNTLPELAPYGGNSLFSGLGDEWWHELSRQLSLSWSSAGRRCSGGQRDACAALLAPFKREGALERLFDRTDYRNVIVAGAIPAGSDSTTYASKRRCLAGADSACSRIIGMIRVNDPTNSMLRGSLAVHAFQLGGEGALARLATAPRGDGIQLLAAVAGVTPDSLIASWQLRISAAKDQGRITTPPVLFSTVLWCGLMLAVTSRRRPS